MKFGRDEVLIAPCMSGGFSADPGQGKNGHGRAPCLKDFFLRLECFSNKSNV